MNTVIRRPIRAGRAGVLSVVSISLTAALAAIGHAYDFGPPALLAGVIVIALLIALGFGYQLSRNRLALVLYVLLSLWIIAGFGIVGGLWNHVIKLLLYVGGGPLPPSVEPWFISLEPGSGAYETVGILTFVASVFAAVFGYRFIHVKPAGPGRQP